ncbi:MAG: tRNA lysidine(34) synthetase TilS [Candidatus Moranbacteria bacterium CG_4_8_14_3_um_filter_34_16]|nr:MAG: tRNA lysidine(34) synthetase TilS [Candidatus Moranbacteria bacterium CG_4_8_14_3_um_filter_34_16]PJA89028.1 MAG: tRNA lysidine(34) synthetase TilS [Candidatus Moranbacteria bacterium CG_4_9_14_3_um_filter_33_15]
MPNLIKKIQNTCHQYNLFQKGSKIVLAVSGGPDSVCMLEIFSRLKIKYSLNVIVAHINYNLRGRDSLKDEEYVCFLAKKNDFKFFLLNTEIKDKFNLESRLRDIRYAFFEEIRRQENFDLIAVAHNLDDQVETFLMRIVRGAGTQGLSAMRFKNNNLIRPLLAISKEEILSFLKKEKIQWRMDKTNRENVFLRNRVRNKLIPFLEKNFNSKIKKTIFNSLVSISQDNDFLEKNANNFEIKSSEIEVSKFLTFHPAMQRRLIRKILKNKKKNLKNITSSQIEEILKITKSIKNKKQFFVMSGLKIEKIGDKLKVFSVKE